MSSIPKSIPIHPKVADRTSSFNSQRHGEIRTLEQFIDDQIRYEQRRYENLRNAILKEELEEQNLFQPQIT
jgi:hypothetical protein